MTTLNFALSRTASRDWQAGDEVVATKLDHDANIAPWLELAHDKGLVVKLADLDEECRIDLDHLRSLVTERTKVVAFPMASNAVGTITPVKEIVEIAHEAGALAWVDAVHYAPHGDIEIPEIGCDVLLCSPYKFYGPHLGLAWVRRELLGELAAVQGAAASELAGQRHETGTLPHELLCGFVAVRRVPARRRLEVHQRARAQARAAVPRRDPGRLDAPRAADDGGPRVDLLPDAARRAARGRRDPARRGRVRGVARQLLRGRGLQAPRARRRRGPRRHRPHEHGGRGRPAARRAAGSR